MSVPVVPMQRESPAFALANNPGSRYVSGAWPDFRGRSHLVSMSKLAKSPSITHYLVDAPAIGFWLSCPSRRLYVNVDRGTLARFRYRS